MDILKVKAVYKRLCDDDKHLEQLEILVGSDKERQLIQSLHRSNQRYRQELIAYIQKQFPEIPSDVVRWREEDFSAWFELLLEYPVFWLNKQESLIGFLWLLDSKGFLENSKYSKQIAQLCTHSNMVDYAADFRNEVVAKTLDALINKYATLSQAEQFQNRVDLKVNEIY